MDVKRVRGAPRPVRSTASPRVLGVLPESPVYDLSKEDYIQSYPTAGYLGVVPQLHPLKYCSVLSNCCRFNPSRTARRTLSCSP